MNRYHIIRATLESMAYQTCDVLRAMEADAGIPITALKVDGRASANDLLMQFQADMIAEPVYRPYSVETTAMGAAYLAGLAVGYFESENEIIRNWRIDTVFKPELPEEIRQKKLRGWEKAVTRARAWAEEE